MRDYHTEGVVDAAAKPEEQVVEGNLWEDSLGTSLLQPTPNSKPALCCRCNVGE